jgi:glycosyltransferase involved in cell wall biosynthesis
LDAIQQLKKNGIYFEFELIHQRDNSYVLSRLLAADIVVDQQSSWFGRFAIEGMASGCVVISGYRPGYNGKEDVYAVINFPDTAEDLASLLQSLVENPERRREQMRQSYECWREFYSAEAFASYLEAILEGLTPNLKPRKNSQGLLLQYCENGFQRLLVRALCH